MSMNAAQYCSENGIHRAPIWRIAGFALNHTATSLNLMMITLASWYLLGPVGIGTIAAAAVMLVLQVFDGITDPVIGFVVDRTSGKFGKNRPFMVLGNLLMFIAGFFMMIITDKLPQIPVLRTLFFALFGLLFFLGYSFQTVVTRSAQACLTNDPSQRALFGAFDTLFTAAVLTAACFMLPGAVGADAGFFHSLWITVAVISAVFTGAAVYAIAPKDCAEFFGTGKRIQLSLKDFTETFRSNQAVRALVITSATDRFAAAARTAAVNTAMFGCLAGSVMLQGSVGAAVLIPGGILAFLAVSLLVSRLGTRKAVLLGSWGGIAANTLLALLWLFGDPAALTSNPASGSVSFSLFTVVFIAAAVCRIFFAGFSSGLIAPMAGDCADYEVYRTGKYIPAMIGAMLSMTEKLAAALAPVLSLILFAAAGFGAAAPTEGDSPNTVLKIGIVVLVYGLSAAGLIFNIFAMKKYPLDKEYMAQIEKEISQIKEQSYVSRF